MRYVLFLACLVIVVMVPHGVSASYVSAEDFSGLHVGDVVVVNVRANTDGQTINALESNLSFSSEVLQFVSSNDSDSVISEWIEKPTLSASGTLRFSGIAPGGFVAQDASVITLTFTVKQSGKGEFRFGESQLLLSDGLGTPAIVTDDSLSLVVTNNTAEAPVLVDTELPEDFTPQIINDPDLFAGQSTLVFSTKDTGSGIDHYEVKEGVLGRYEPAVSPYLVEHQKLDTVLFIKAIDHAGNARIQELYPPHWQPWYKPPKVIAVVLLPGILLLLIGWLWYRRTRRR